MYFIDTTPPHNTRLHNGQLDDAANWIRHGIPLLQLHIEKLCTLLTTLNLTFLTDCGITTVNMFLNLPKSTTDTMTLKGDLLQKGLVQIEHCGPGAHKSYHTNNFFFNEVVHAKNHSFFVVVVNPDPFSNSRA